MQQTTRCPHCGSANALNRKFCVGCGAKLGSSCPNCGATLDSNDRFCGSCGAQISGGVPQQQAPVQTAPDQQSNQPGSYSGSRVVQPEYGMPQVDAGAYETPWEPVVQGRRSTSMPMIILLVVLLIGLGVFAWWAFAVLPGGSASQQTTDVPPGTPLEINPGPFISPKLVTDNTSTVRDLTIVWYTNQITVSEVEYGASEEYGNTTTWETIYTKSHEVLLTDLTAGMGYHYRIISKDQQGTEITSVDYTFNTNW